MPNWIKTAPGCIEKEQPGATGLVFRQAALSSILVLDSGNVYPDFAGSHPSGINGFAAQKNCARAARVL